MQKQCNLDLSNLRVNEKTLIHRKIRYTEARFVEIIPVLLRYDMNK